MDYLYLYQDHLFSQRDKLTAVSAKNYVSDVRKFVSWCVQTTGESFVPERITTQTIAEFKNDLLHSNYQSSQTSAIPYSAQSVERYLSSLRKFFSFLEDKALISSSPFKQAAVSVKEDTYILSEFKNYLYLKHISYLSIKNYINDIHLFLSWLSKSIPVEIDKKNVLAHISSAVILEYQQRLKSEGLSPATINRKLSSLRIYLGFLQKKDILGKNLIVNNNISHSNDTDWDKDLQSTSKQPKTHNYSNIPPVRFFQKLWTGQLWLIYHLIVYPIVLVLLTGKYFLWQISGRHLFVPTEKISPNLKKYLAQRTHASWNRQKKYSAEFYAKLHSFKTRRKKLYPAQLSYPLFIKKPAFYFSLLACCILIFVFYLIYVYQQAKLKGSVLGASTNQAQRVLSFQGKLQHQDHSPITTPTDVRFSLYNDPDASSSALLWQTVKRITPSSDGSFVVSLGDGSTSLPEDIFTHNSPLYMGTTIGQTNELRPRQEIPTVSLASNAISLQGMNLVNQTPGTQRNVILALDSSGNLHIGNSSPVFSATDGTLTLQGQTTILTSNANSNGNVVLSPDGTGTIDIQKGITNSTENGIFPGAVEIADQLAVIATTSGQPALQVTQNYTGDLISASNSGQTKFSVNYLGDGLFADNLAINGNTLSSQARVFHLLNEPFELHIGENANTLMIGSSSGTLTINNPTTTLSGNLTISGSDGIHMGGQDAGISFAGAGEHNIKAQSGNILFGSNINLGRDIAIIPDSNDGTNDIGSSDRPFDSLYIKNISSLDTVQINTHLSLGTNNAIHKLDVTDNQDSKPSALIQNSNNSTTASVLALQLGGANLSSSNHFIDFLNGNGDVIGSISSNGINGLTMTNTTLAGFAEYLPKHADAQLPPGTVVCLMPDGAVAACDTTTSHLAGIISAHPTILAGIDKGTSSAIVAFTGQLPILVSTQNGPIEAGDPLTLSSIPGVAVKAISAGPIIGKALQSYTNPNQYITSSILALEQTSWYDPGIQLTSTGELSIQPLMSNQLQKNSSPASYSLLTQLGQTISTIAAYSQATIANLQAGLVHTQQLLVDGTATFLGEVKAQSVSTGKLVTDNIVLSGINLQDYISQQIQQSKLSNANTNLASAPSLQTNVISPIGQNTDVAIKANVDIAGNASVSGKLASSELQTQDASISGTLHAHKIIADEIDGLPSSSTSATYITNVTNVYTQEASNSATQAASQAQMPPPPANDLALATSSTQPTDQSLIDIANDTIKPLPNNINLASYSALLSEIPQLQVTTGFTSLGISSFGDTSISGELSVDGNLFLQNGAINVVGSDLALQPLRQGRIDFLGGLVMIDTAGNMQVSGNALFAQNIQVKGTVQTNTISPLANNNLVLQLASPSSSLIIANASSSAVTITNSGDVQASGSGNFADLIANALQIVRGAQADTSTTQTIATASAGTAIIYKGQLERTILTPFVKSTSLIYITPTSDTAGLTPYVARQTDRQIDPTQPNSFTIRIPSVATKDIHMNWWVVN